MANFIYFKGADKAAVYVYNPLTGRKRYIPAREADLIKVAMPEDWAARKSIPQASADAIPEDK